MRAQHMISDHLLRMLRPALRWLGAVRMFEAMCGRDGPTTVLVGKIILNTERPQFRHSSAQEDTTSAVLRLPQALFCAATHRSVLLHRCSSLGGALRWLGAGVCDAALRISSNVYLDSWADDVYEQQSVVPEQATAE